MPMAWLTLFIVEQSAIQEMDYQVASSQEQGGRREPNMVIVSLPLVFIGANTEPESA